MDVVIFLFQARQLRRIIAQKRGVQAPKARQWKEK